MPHDGLGDYQNPLALAIQCVQTLDLPSDARILEPTCGRGAFLHAASIVSPQSERRGIEINPEYYIGARMSNILTDPAIITQPELRAIIANPYSLSSKTLITTAPTWFTPDDPDCYGALIDELFSIEKRILHHIITQAIDLNDHIAACEYLWNCQTVLAFIQQHNRTLLDTGDPMRSERVQFSQTLYEFLDTGDTDSFTKILTYRDKTQTKLEFLLNLHHIFTMMDYKLLETIAFAAGEHLDNYTRHHRHILLGQDLIASQLATL